MSRVTITLTYPESAQDLQKDKQNYGCIIVKVRRLQKREMAQKSAKGSTCGDEGDDREDGHSLHLPPIRVTL